MQNELEPTTLAKAGLCLLENAILETLAKASEVSTPDLSLELLGNRDDPQRAIIYSVLLKLKQDGKIRASEGTNPTYWRIPVGMI